MAQFSRSLLFASLLVGAIPALLTQAAYARMDLQSAGSLPSDAQAGMGLRYGPFRVVTANRLELTGLTDTHSPAALLEVMRDFPSIRVLELRDCPGTVDDVANLRLGRLIRRMGIRTEVPANGSVRSGAIELFLAGKERGAATSARFVIHAWQADPGLRGQTQGLTSVMFETYTRYYKDMGMSTEDAQAFYRQTMAVPSSSGISLQPRELGRYVPIVPISRAKS